jgi:hypothetical protein
MMTSTSLPTRRHIVLPNEDETAVAVHESADGIGLPGWSTLDAAGWEDTPSVNWGVFERYGTRVTTLRSLFRDWTNERRDIYYLVDLLDRNWEPPAGMRWMSADEAKDDAWRSSAQLRVALTWFGETASPSRVRWYRRGWFSDACTWIDTAFYEAGLIRCGDVEQLRSWERSAIMRARSESGWHYFKETPPQWGHEPVLTKYLSQRFPDVMPEVIKADGKAGRLLVNEFSGEPLPDSRDPARWCRAYAALGRVQRSLAQSAPSLVKLGVPFRPIETILNEMPELLVDVRRMRLGLDGGISDAEFEVLNQSQPLLQAACRRLIEGPIPLSLDHGDFWPGNMFADDNSVTLFDWSDAAITHPFFSLVMARDEIAESLKASPETVEEVVTAYLAEWQAFASLDELRSIFDDAMLVAPIHLGLMYRDVYLPAMEFVDELDRMTPHFMRWLARKV